MSGSIWVVVCCSGEYSDYGETIMGWVSTKDEAEAFAAKSRAEDGSACHHGPQHIDYPETEYVVRELEYLL